jgi:hypothetical protein
MARNAMTHNVWCNHASPVAAYDNNKLHLAAASGLVRTLFFEANGNFNSSY